ncbi:MAG: hypothetical protein VKK42_30010 [Lyngbya sp.]|nr:hypothetical protein [Lyngbya sp.]
MSTETRPTEVIDLVVNSKDNCYLLKDHIEAIQNTAVKQELTSGIWVVRIRKGSFDYIKDDPQGQKGEALVMLWMYGGKFKNLKTNKIVPAGWSTLNGFDDTVTLAVSEPITLCAFFFDIYLEDNDGDVTVSVVKVGELSDIEE